MNINLIFKQRINILRAKNDKYQIFKIKLNHLISVHKDLTKAECKNINNENKLSAYKIVDNNF